MQLAVDESYQPEKARVFWKRPLTKDYGGFIGYRNLALDLDECVEHDPDSRVVFHLNDPSGFRPIEGKANVLYTMWETTDFPRCYVDIVNDADAIVVPSTFCRDIFSKFFDGPIHVVPMAVDATKWNYVRRKKPRNGEPFRWLWVNSADPRKGQYIVATVWETYFLRVPGVELYMKTTNNTEDVVERRGNVVFDSRYLPTEELLELYHSAHGFLYPSWGEGFGLSLAEAMSTGLPSVATDWSGYKDFFNAATGWPCGYMAVRGERKLDPKKEIPNHLSLAEDGKYTVAICNPSHMMKNMDRIMLKYSKATEKASRGAKLLQEKHSLDGMRENLKAVIRLYE